MLSGTLLYLTLCKAIVYNCYENNIRNKKYEKILKIFKTQDKCLKICSLIKAELGYLLRYHSYCQ